MRKNAIAAATAAVLVVGGAVYYAAGGPPFGGDGEGGGIAVDRVCAQLGPAEPAARTLDGILPATGTYRFSAGTAERRVKKSDGYATACRILDGDRNMLFVAHTEMLATEPVAGWFSTVRARDYPDRQLRGFGPGNSGRSSGRAAAILVPCAPGAQSPEGPRSLGVTVRLPSGVRERDVERARTAVQELALAAARQSHRDAGCDLPSGLPAA
ncbi:hypothetical protein AB0G74_10165 [Streptomyces sp. NPDC020875]|uniref:hypothetical protein n=1 Tax=Streptomyces sp. NPDC020875 TaxID=3154898 RepID=UPI0033ED6E19